MRIIDSYPALEAFCTQGPFEWARWRAYVNQVMDGLEQVCVEDMQLMLKAGGFSFDEQVAPVLNMTIMQRERRRQVHNVFVGLCQDLPEQVREHFGRCPEVDIVFYLGLCNGAGWVVEVNGRTCLLLGVEKILELKWDNPGDMRGLIFHELGHAHHMQFGQFEQSFKNQQQQYLWQLFSEGIAMCYAQILAGDKRYYHQDKDGWLAWCEANEPQIKQDFIKDLPAMNAGNQRWFGDWVSYQGWGDVGYYLGARFIQFIGESLTFEQITLLHIGQIEQYFRDFFKR